MELRGNNFIGILFYGTNGYMVVEDSGFKIVLGDKQEPGETMKMVEDKQDKSTAHVSNFLQAVRSGRWKDLGAEVREAAVSADLIHINASYRTGRKLTLESGGTRFVSDNEANNLLTGIRIGRLTSLADPGTETP